MNNIRRHRYNIRTIAALGKGELFIHFVAIIEPQLLSF